MSLFTQAELADWLKKPVSVSRHAVVERVVWGWLKPLWGTEESPYPVPAELFAWALELGGIAHENPAGLSARQMGPYLEQFSAERRDKILAEVAGSSLATGSSTKPTGSFPAALEYPDGTW